MLLYDPVMGIACYVKRWQVDLIKVVTMMLSKHWGRCKT